MRRKAKMKKQPKPYITCIGIIIIVLGAILAFVFNEAIGIMQNLPFILMGCGAGLTGMGITSFYIKWLSKNNPEKLKQMNKEENDERNIRLREKAGYTTWFVTTLVLFGMTMIFVALDYGIARWLSIGVLVIHNISLFVCISIHNKKI
jgi:hypothetical protein